LNNILSNKSNSVDYRILNGKYFLESLKTKFFEELEELNLDDKEDAVKELADLQLIIDTCLKKLKVNKKDFGKIGKDKNKKFGTFNKRIYIKTVELDEKDEWFSYYEKKFEEIK